MFPKHSFLEHRFLKHILSLFLDIFSFLFSFSSTCLAVIGNGGCVIGDGGGGDLARKGLLKQYLDRESLRFPLEQILVLDYGWVLTSLVQE